MSELDGDTGGTMSSAADAAPASATPDASSGTATIEPGASGPHGATAEPPQERWPAILENARKKEREAVEAQYAHLRDVDANEIAGYRQFSQLASMDKGAAFNWLARQLGYDPNPRPASGNGDGKPQPDLRTEDGRLVYSAEQAEKLSMWIVSQAKQELTQEIAPLKQYHQQSQIESQARAEASSEIAEVMALPYAAEHKAEIIQAFKADGRLTSLRKAYDRVVLPKLRQLEREAVVKEYQQKAGASTVNPSSTGASAPKPFKSFAEGLRYHWDRAKAKA